MPFDADALVIVNPAAGGGSCGRRADAALKRLRAANWRFEVATTTAPGEATTLARDAWADGCRGFVAAGGDGTSFEIVNGLAEAFGPGNGERRPWLGPLPLGTGNSFLRDFLPSGADASEHALAALLESRRRTCDVLRLIYDVPGDEPRSVDFLNLMGIGFAADVATTVNRRFKALGPVGYVAGVLVELAKLHARPVTLSLDGGLPSRAASTFVCICNSRFTGGAMEMAPAADPADGRADVVRVGELGRLGLLRAFPRIYRGTHVDLPQVDSTPARTVDFDLPEAVDVMIDGEVRRLRPRRVEVLAGALEICA